MLDPQKRAALDQATAAFIDVFPSQWRQIYLRLVDEGFTESQAIDILKAYITASHRT